MSHQGSRRVFVSAVSSEFQSFRKAASDALLTLGIHPITQDYFAPDTRSVSDLLRDKIESCDAVLCLLGKAYGFEPQCANPRQPRRSYTQLEFDVAVKLNKPVFRFKAADDCQVDRTPNEPPELLALQLEHVRRLTSTNQLWYEFRSAADLAAKVLAIRLWPEQSGGGAIVPRGLRSFDQLDERFFLQLLPGPYDQEGLPESIRFWKHRIETTSGPTFAVGIIYGPSGCGKSSLVKAGLLPRLSQWNVVPIYLEATSDDTERRLLEELTGRFPSLLGKSVLSEAIEALKAERRGTNGQKVLLVLDQFEQWLHGRANVEQSDLVSALRQCDGRQVQCIVMVRDDYWTAVTRFLNATGSRLREDDNAAVVNPFGLSHARSVLAKLGRAFGRLPAEDGELSAEQDAFLDQAIDDLSQAKNVMPIRLAISAEILKDRPWTPATLEAVGGMSGLGVTFLEQTFGDRALNAQHRAHQRGAIAVLKALLPEPGIAIKRQVRSLGELQKASGYRDQQAFAELIQLLDTELRLITPTGSDAAAESCEPAAGVAALITEKCYQLTHDYLVQALREWLPRKQQETRRGRAALLLASRESHWKVQCENRFLPSAREYLVIRMLTQPRDWTDDQKRMMRRAGRVHFTRGLMLAAGLMAGGVAALLVADRWQLQHAEEKIHTLLSADIKEAPGAINDLQRYRRWANPLLQTAFRTGVHDWRDSSDSGEPSEFRETRAMRIKTLAALALLSARSVEPAEEHADFLFDRLLDCETAAFPVIRDCLIHDEFGLPERLWPVLEDEAADRWQRLRAACVLAYYAKDDADRSQSRWVPQAAFVAESMVEASAKNLNDYELTVVSLEPASRHLIEPLEEVFRSPRRPELRGVAANILARYAADDDQLLADLLIAPEPNLEADPTSFDRFFAVLKSRPSAARALKARLGLAALSTGRALDDPHAVPRANAAIALLRLNDCEEVWPLLASSSDPLLRSQIMHRLGVYGAPAELLVKRVQQRAPGDVDASIRRALILALGEFDGAVFAEPARSALVKELLALYQNDHDPATRGSAEWLLRRWNQDETMKQIDQSLRGAEPREGRGWYVNNLGQTMVVVQPGQYRMGSALDDSSRESNEEPHDVLINTAFAIAAHEVTNGQFRQFPGHAAWLMKLEEWVARKDIHREQRDDLLRPAVGVSWYDAAAYCNWLSEQDGVPREHWCYEPNDDGNFAAGMRTRSSLAKLQGYRLPTEAEWEYACRAGTATSRYYGQGDNLLPNYAWFRMNSNGSTQRVGLKKPNDFGLFDTLGNALEWCQDGIQSQSNPGVFLAEDAASTGGDLRIMRGAMYLNLPQHVRAARRLDNRTTRPPGERDYIFGFRPVRTVTLHGTLGQAGRQADWKQSDSTPLGAAATCPQSMNR